MDVTINIDGTIGTPENSFVSVLDRGFLYGDSVYEVVRTYQGKIFALEQHYRRFCSSAARLGIELPDKDWLFSQIDRTIAASGNQESYCRVIVTRGEGPLTLDPTTAIAPSTVIIVKGFEPFPEETFRTGIRVWIPNVRRTSTVSLDPSIKSGNYLNSVMAFKEARMAGFDDSLMLDFDGNVTEATSSNVFISNGKKIYTPAFEVGLLPGVTRALLLSLLAQNKIAYEECTLSLSQVEQADEVMLTSTIREIQPVVMVGNHVIGSGKPGPVAQKLRALFHAHALSM